MSGARSYHAGLCAEAAVEQYYARAGRAMAARRWRGKGGEIDLIARDGETVIFVEVKKSRSHARAAERLSRRQMARLYQAASEFLANEPRGLDTDARFDVALVDATGRISVLENALCA